MDSILTSIKKLLGITEDYKQFDDDLIIHINSVFMILSQLGIGPPEGFAIEDEYAEWRDFIGNTTNIELVKSYIGLRVKLLFDPPQSSAAVDSVNRMISEFEWRLMASVESKNST